MYESKQRKGGGGGIQRTRQSASKVGKAKSQRKEEQEKSKTMIKCERRGIDSHIFEKKPK